MTISTVEKKAQRAFCSWRMKNYAGSFLGVRAAFFWTAWVFCWFALAIYIDTKNKKRRAFFFEKQNSDTGARAGSPLNPANNGVI